MMASRSQILDPQIAAHGGRVIKYIADTAFAEFSSAVAAVNCALAIQNVSETAKVSLGEANRVRFRVGVHLGEVIVEGNEIYGDGIVVAARLQVLAPPGAVVASPVVRDQVEGKIPCTFEDIGEQAVGRNSRRHVHAFLIRPANAAGH